MGKGVNKRHAFNMIICKISIDRRICLGGMRLDISAAILEMKRLKNTTRNTMEKSTQTASWNACWLVWCWYRESRRTSSSDRNLPEGTRISPGLYSMVWDGNCRSSFASLFSFSFEFILNGNWLFVFKTFKWKSEREIYVGKMSRAGEYLNHKWLYR